MISRLKISAVIIILISALVFAGASIMNVSAKSDEGVVKVSWNVNSETNLKNYCIERKPLNGDYTEIGRIPAENKNYYEFMDYTAYKNDGAIYVYRIKLLDSDNSYTYSAEVNVSHQVSSVKRTWGSIKSLFR